MNAINKNSVEFVMILATIKPKLIMNSIILAILMASPLQQVLHLDTLQLALIAKQM